MEQNNEQAKYKTHDERRQWALDHWKAWGSWFSWGSPVGMGIGWFLFIVGLGIFLYLIGHVGLIG